MFNSSLVVSLLSAPYETNWFWRYQEQEKEEEVSRHKEEQEFSKSLNGMESEYIFLCCFIYLILRDVLLNMILCMLSFLLLAR